MTGSSASASPQDSRRASGASAPLSFRFATEPHRGDSLCSAESNEGVLYIDLLVVEVVGGGGFGEGEGEPKEGYEAGDYGADDDA